MSTLNKSITRQNEKSLFYFEKDSIFDTTGWMKVLLQFLLFVLVFLFIFLSFVIIRPLNKMNGTTDGLIAKVYGGAFIGITLIVYAFLVIFKKNSFNKTIVTILLLALFIQLTYMLYTQGTTRQYDTWSTNNDAHYDYALSFYLTGQLPDHHIDASSIYQFYHPPLNAFIQGMFMRLCEIVIPVESLTSSIEMLFIDCQILSCFYMFLTSVFFAKTILKTKLSNGSKILAIAICCLYPRLIQLSGQLNNDALCICMSAIAFYFFYKWYLDHHSFSSIMLAGLFIGLAMMAKLSGAIICVGIAIVFIIEFVKAIRKKGQISLGRLTSQYLLFLVICAPLGLWFQFYSHYVYGLPFNFVFNNLNSSLFTGTRDWVLTNKPTSITSYDNNNSGLIYENSLYNIFIRFILPIDFTEFFSISGNVFFCSAFNNYNVLSYALRSSIFGEFTYWNGEIFGVFAVISLYVVYFLLIIYLVYALVKRNKIGQDGMASLFIFLGIIVMFLYLQMSMPYGCSMDFRYIVPIILPASILLGKANDTFKENLSLCYQDKRANTLTHNLREEKVSYVHSKNYRNVLLVSSGVFITSSYLFYMVAI